MGLIKEPKSVDLSTKSEPWTEQELSDFRKIMQGIKAKNAKRKEKALQFKSKHNLLHVINKAHCGFFRTCDWRN